MAGPQTSAERLFGATGRERLSLLADLTTAHLERDPSRVLVYGKEALALVETFPDPELELRVLNALCYAAFRRERHRMALKYGARAEELARRTGDSAELAFALTHMGNASRRLGEHHRGLAYSLEAADLYEGIGDRTGLGTALNGVGYAHWRMGRYPKAFEFYRRAHDAFEAAGDRRGIAKSLRNIGILHLDTGDAGRAIGIFERALEIQRQEGNESEIGKLLSEISKARIMLGDLTMALEGLLSSLRIKEKLGDRTGIAVVWGFMGRAYFEMGDLESAMDYYQQALRLRRDIGDRMREAYSLIQIASVHRMRGEYEAAIERLQESLAIASEIDAKPELQAAYRDLSATYEGQGRYREALAASRQYERIKNEISGEQGRGTLGELDAVLEAAPPRAGAVPLRASRGDRALESDRQRTIRAAVVLGLIALALVVPIVGRRRVSRLIARKDEEIRQALDKLAESEERNRRLQDERSGAGLQLDPAEGRGLEADDARDRELAVVFGDTDAASCRGPSPPRAGDRTAAQVAATPEGGSIELVFPEGYRPGESAAIRRMYQAMRSLVGADLTVLIEGETGVGKECVTRILHLSSSRSGGPFVAVNCAAIPGELLEAEMFGIGSGVATGVSSRPGKFRSAHGGTLFLDEIGEMPPELQAKLLRAVQERKVQPVGGEEIPADVWVVAASNQDLLTLIDDGKFRKDLYYRLAGYVLKVPPLRDRREDLVPLIEHFLKRERRQLRGLTAQALAMLTGYAWPGNVRELEHEVKRLARLAEDGEVIDSAMLGERFLGSNRTVSSRPAPGSEPMVDGSDAAKAQAEAPSCRLKDHVHEVERQVILRALAQAGRKRRKAAELLGISRSTLTRKLHDLGISARAR